MAGKLKTITVRPEANPNTPSGKPFVYRVERITDSLEYPPGAWLERDTVESLCESKSWKVTIK